MDCLQNYVGLEQCNDQSEPGSGMYINTLAGISTEVLQKIANPEQGTYDRVWESIQRVAGIRFYSDVIAKLRERYKLKTVKTQLEFIPSPGGDAEPASNQYRGIHLKFQYETQTFQAFTISEIPVVTGGAGSMVLKVFDKLGLVLFTKTVTVAAGLNRIRVDRIFSVDELYVGLNFQAVDGAETAFVQDVISGFIYGCQSCGGWCMDCEPIIEGFTSDDGLTFTATSRQTHGLGIIGFIGCDYKSIVCNNKDLFLSSWMFLLGNQIMVNILSSPRSNQATTVDRKKYEELRDYYQLEYEKQIENILSGYALRSEGDCCIECNENPVHQEWLP